MAVAGLYQGDEYDTQCDEGDPCCVLDVQLLTQQEIGQNNRK